jgi:hypothetical protein
MAATPWNHRRLGERTVSDSLYSTKTLGLFLSVSTV